MNAVLDKISKIGIVPVVKINRAEDALPLAKALCAGGLPCAEITFRTDAAAEAIKIMTEHFPQMCVGAGTVLTTGQVDAAIAAGAQFIVSPGLNPRIVRYCIEKKIPITPGTSSPSELEQAIELGLDVVKFFPAEQSGGLAKIKAMAAPYTNMKFMPTGGIHAGNLNSYLDFDRVIACGGSWMVPGSRFAFLFGMPVKDGAGSLFAGTALEVMKKPYLGQNGHIAIKTNYIERAVNYLSTVLQAEFDPSTEKRDTKGALKAVYLKEEIGGFAVHLLQK